jgi:hypothetical protein
MPKLVIALWTEHTLQMHHIGFRVESFQTFCKHFSIHVHGATVMFAETLKEFDKRHDGSSKAHLKHQTVPTEFWGQGS